jgi:hypothetical protein
MPTTTDLVHAAASEELELQDYALPLAWAASWRLILQGETYVLK